VQLPSNQESQMKEMPLSRRQFASTLAAAAPVLLATRNAFARAGSGAVEKISLSAEAIHQEVVFKVSPQRVFEAMMDEKQFSALTGAPATISREPGGPLSLFGGRVSARNVELEPGQRIVQAWRSEGWKPHIYSIARFELAAEGADTRLSLDHTGFPVGEAKSLAGGWKNHYWEALEKYFAS
jgi:activator of HSP90 ATPase